MIKDNNGRTCSHIQEDPFKGTTILEAVGPRHPGFITWILTIYYLCLNLQWLDRGM